MLNLLKKDSDKTAGLNVLRIDASARRNGSVSRHLSNGLFEKLAAKHTIANLAVRDLADGMPHVSEDWIGANFTPADQRSAEQSATLRFSDELVDELIAAAVILIGLPMYNFSVPASFKAWIDQVARVGRTFQYTDDGPKGLLAGKKVIVSIATGGTPSGSPVDFASAYVRFFLGFIGIEDVTFINADKVGQSVDQALEANGSALETIVAAITQATRQAA